MAANVDIGTDNINLVARYRSNYAGSKYRIETSQLLF